MSDRQAWHGQPYLDELRPGRLETVKLALFATYSVDLSAVAAALLALIGRNNDKGSGTAADFAEAIDRLRDHVKIIIQRGRIARPVVLPRIAGILDQFIVEQPYDEHERSWHPKIALVAYNCPKGETRWKLWIGSRNLTRSQDLEAGVLLDGSEKRAKGRVRLPGVGALGSTLARSASREDADDISEQLEAIWWDAPDGFRLRGLLNGLDEGVPLSAEPPSGAVDGITIISPFLSPDFLKKAGNWGAAGSRALISSMPALADLASRSKTSLTGFSKILAYAAPDVLADESTLALPGTEPVAEDDVEPTPLALHAKIFCFHSGEKTILRVGSANATERAWSGRNSEIMVELEAGEAFASGLAFLVGKATPVTIEELATTDLRSTSAADALEESRKVLMASWDPVLRRDGECFSIDARAVPSLAYPYHVLHAGSANGDLLPWPTDAIGLGLGSIPLSLQSAFIQVRISGPDGALRWMQRVTVDPPLEEQRDLAALASHMGLRAFHDWMRAMLGGDTLPVGGGAWDEDVGSRGNRPQSLGYDRLTLEDILTAWARDRKAFGRVDRHFAPYVDALLAHDENLSEAERADLNELAQIWAIARSPACLMSARSKPFQAATVKAATVALSGGNPLRRFLVADEVGLGKTVVARDTLAALASKARKFTVYYITSGLKVADQNKVELLRFLEKDEAKDALSAIDRVGLIPFEEKRKGKLRLYTFTPTTSFSSSQRLYGGKAVERAFIKLLLDELYPGLTAAFPEGYVEYGAKSGWRWACEEAQGKFDNVSALFKAAYGRALGAEFGKPARENILHAIDTSKHGQSLGRMRKALAQAALDSAPPDLVIFDEFQCYRELLNAGADNPLARQLLAGTDGGTPPPILLLSATPYRFYAERWESGAGAAPHVEFFEIIEFLGGSAVRAEAESQFRRFGDLLHLIGHLPPDSRTAAIEEAQTLKHHLEALLTPLMSRTERPVSDHAGEPAPPSVRIEPHDLDVYRHFTDHVSPKLAGSAIAYWLSVPLPAQALGDRYQISRDIDFPATRSVPRLGVTNCFKPPKEGWGSAKLRALNSLVPAEALALPWVLPSLTWWVPSGPWAKVTQSPKMLIFSRFRATPQSLAALVSLEVERKCVAKRNLPYAAAWKKRHLNPKPNQGPTLALFHPSPFLIRAVDPLDVKGKVAIKQIRARARQQIIRALPPSIAPEAPNARSNRRRKPAWAILAAIERAQKAPLAREFAAVQKNWGRVAPKDATLQTLLKQRQEAEAITWLSRWELDALVDMALGAPGVVTGRALYRHLPELFDYREQHFARLVRFCWTRLRTYLDRPVFWSILPGEDATQKYQNACVDGCLEAVLDEHFWLRKSKVNPDGLIEDLSAALAANVGTFGFKGAKKKDKIRIRCHAAVPFGGTETETHRQDHHVNEPPPARSEEIRSAFNTPFWPHVLATTSVGQEGLDFHSWCDRLGHWDLCSSPVDLEQREGRIQRFGGLTVRQPLARKLGEQALAQARGQASSPWDIIARDADKAFADDKTGLSPWWAMEGAELKRHLFALPQSRDIDRFAKLRTQRLLYRLALGQPDQEDLVDLLTHHDVETTRSLQALTLDLSAFSRQKHPDE